MPNASNNTQPLAPITGPSVWQGSDLSADQTSWTIQLTTEQLDCLDAALRTLKRAGKTGLAFSTEDFTLPGWEGVFATLAEELENGIGFRVLRGIPVARYNEDDIRTLYYCIGLKLGVPVRQNPKGDLIGAVMNVADAADKTARVYETNAYLPYHTDPSDVVGLLCLRKAKAGGVSSLLSVASVYNAMLERHPRQLQLLYRPWFYAHLGEDLPTPSPLFSYHGGKLAFRYLRQYIELGHDMMDQPLTAEERDALDSFDAIMAEPGRALDMMLEPGDLQFANNYTVLHSRTQFDDDEDPALKRKMLRLWLKMPNARSLAPDFPGRNGFPAPADIQL